MNQFANLVTLLDEKYNNTYTSSMSIEGNMWKTKTEN